MGLNSKLSIMRQEYGIVLVSALDQVGNVNIIAALKRDKRRLEKML